MEFAKTRHYVAGSMAVLFLLALASDGVASRASSRRDVSSAHRIVLQTTRATPFQLSTLPNTKPLGEVSRNLSLLETPAERAISLSFAVAPWLPLAATVDGHPDEADKRQSDDLVRRRRKSYKRRKKHDRHRKKKGKKKGKKKKKKKKASPSKTKKKKKKKS